MHLQIVMCIGHVGAKCQGFFEDQFGVRQFALLSENVAKVSQSYIVKKKKNRWTLSHNKACQLFYYAKYCIYIDKTRRRM